MTYAIWLNGLVQIPGAVVLGLSSSGNIKSSKNSTWYEQQLIVIMRPIGSQVVLKNLSFHELHLLYQMIPINGHLIFLGKKPINYASLEQKAVNWKSCSFCFVFGKSIG